MVHAKSGHLLIWIWLTAGMPITFGQTKPQLWRFRVEVRDSSTDAPVELAVVRVITYRKTLFTSDRGQTSFITIDADAPLVTLRINHINYYTHTQSVHIGPDSTCRIWLKPYRQLLDEVIVRGKRDNESVLSHSMSTVSLTAKQIENTPSIGGEKDVVKTLLLLPGVKTETEGSSSFNVRGGGSDQNLLLLNGVTLYSSNHLFGLLSTYNSDIIREVNLIKGAFPAQYGGRLSSVLDVRTREGDYEHVQARASVSLLAARALVEVPLVKQKLSLLVSGRRTYIDALFPTRQNGINPTVGLSFYDVNARLSWRLNKTNKVSLFAYKDNDHLSTLLTGTRIEDNRLNWQNQIATLQWERFVSARRTMSFQGFISDYRMRVYSHEERTNQNITQTFETAIKDISFRTMLEQHTRGTWQSGFQYTVRGFRPNAITYNSLADNLQFAYKAAVSTLHEAALFSEHQGQWSSRWGSSLGLRLVAYRGGDRTYFSLEPRLSAKYEFSQQSSLKISYARMQQPVHLLTNPGLGIPIDLWVPANERVAPQTSEQIALGYFLAGRHGESSLTASVELYAKRMGGVISYLDGKSSNDVASLSADQNWESVITTGRAWAYGMELLIEKKKGQLTGWAGYTLASVRQQFDQLNRGQPFYPRYDKRHEISLVVNYRMSAQWQLNASWVFSTGQPITLPVQAFRVPNFTLLNSQIPTSTKGLLYVQGDRNAFRMTPFHRLNIAIQRIRPHRWGQSTFEVGLYNAYNRRNPFYYFVDSDASNVIQLKSLSVFPVLPGISYTAQFHTY